MKNSIVFVGLVLLLVVSCTENPCGESKTEFLGHFEAFCDKIPTEEKHFSDAEWVEYDEAFKKYVEECYKLHETDLTIGEKKQFWTKTANFYYRRYGASVANEVLDKSHPVYKELKNYLAELENDPNGAFKDILNQLGGKEMKELLNEVSGDVEKWGKKLEKILDKN